MELLNALGNIGFDWRIAIANFINFVIIYFLLNKFVFKGLSKTLDERREKIESGLQQAQDAQALHEKASQEHEEALRIARLEANEIVASAREKETAVINGASSKAAKEAEHIISDAKQKAAAEHDSMLSNFKSEASGLVVAAAEKLLQDEIASPEKKAVAQKYLDQIKTKI